jgi:hypothetical protein
MRLTNDFKNLEAPIFWAKPWEEPPSRPGEHNSTTIQHLLWIKMRQVIEVKNISWKITMIEVGNIR